MHSTVSGIARCGLWLVAASQQAGARIATAQDAPLVTASTGLRLLTDRDNAAPTLRLVLPGRPDSDRSIVILFPEHVTAVRQGATDGEHLYRWEAGTRGNRPVWIRTENSLGYERDLPGPIHLVARATLDSDGVRFRYELHNQSTTSWTMITAVTDPRLTSIFHDVRLERTYVHYPTGFELLAAERPERVTLPLREWLPARYLASYTWPVPVQRRERRDDGITYYHTSRRVDQPFIATLSSDSAWVIASFTRSTGNVWTNPELTCQHVDPQVTLTAGGLATIEVKLLVLRASLPQAFERMLQQRDSLRRSDEATHSSEL